MPLSAVIATSAPVKLSLHAPQTEASIRILNEPATELLVALNEAFGQRRIELLAARHKQQAKYDRGELPDFPKETAAIRNSDWRVAPIPEVVKDRRVEITGPVDRKMVINALNSGANVFMADFEDSSAPSWSNMIEGQVNIADAVAKSISFTAANGKHYQLNEQTAVLMVRPRGLHLSEKHLRIEGQELSASLVDFALFMAHNARKLADQGLGPFLYLPKLESYLEARWWNDVFRFTEQQLGLPAGSVRATVLIETLPAAFQMDEILYELRDYALGLNCGRWDYIFSYIKTLRKHPSRSLPGRSQVTMDKGFLRAYSERLVAVCHRRGAFGMGGMAAQIPIKDDPEANAAALAKVVADKQREVESGHDGTWVAHPGLIAPVRDIFDKHLEGANQIHVEKESTEDSIALLEPIDGSISEDDVRANIRVAILYLTAWLSGNGCVPIDNLMEDAATAEISRAQLWQWRTHRAYLDDGRPIADELLEIWIADEQSKIRDSMGADRAADTPLGSATELLKWLVFADELEDFLTIPAYQHLKHGVKA